MRGGGGAAAIAADKDLGVAPPRIEQAVDDELKLVMARYNLEKAKAPVEMRKMGSDSSLRVRLLFRVLI